MPSASVCYRHVLHKLLMSENCFCSLFYVHETCSNIILRHHVHFTKFFRQPGSITDVFFRAGWACSIHSFPVSAPSRWFRDSNSSLRGMILPPQLPGSCHSTKGFFKTFIQAVHEILSMCCWNIEILTYVMSRSLHFSTIYIFKVVLMYGALG